MSDTLIDITDFEPYRAISGNINITKRLDPFILEAQQFDLRKTLGKELVQDLIDDPADADNVLLLPYVKPVLVYYAYARFIGNQNINATAYGIVQKKENYSEPIEEKTIQRLISQARSGALAYEQDMIKFILDAKATDPTKYPLYKCTKQSTRKGITKISAVTPRRGEKYWCGRCSRWSDSCLCETNC